MKTVEKLEFEHKDPVTGDAYTDKINTYNGYFGVVKLRKGGYLIVRNEKGKLAKTINCKNEEVLHSTIRMIKGDPMVEELAKE